MQSRGKLEKVLLLLKINKYNVASGGPDVPLRNVLLKLSPKVGSCPRGNQLWEQQLP